MGFVAVVLIGLLGYYLSFGYQKNAKLGLTNPRLIHNGATWALELDKTCLSEKVRIYINLGDITMQPDIAAEKEASASVYVFLAERNFGIYANVFAE